MCRVGDTGIFSLFVPEISIGDIYKYEIKKDYQTVFLKTDPYGFACEQRPNNASVVTNISTYNGVIQHGFPHVRRRTTRKSLYQYMKSILVHGVKRNVKAVHQRVMKSS